MRRTPSKHYSCKTIRFSSSSTTTTIHTIIYLNAKRWPLWCGANALATTKNELKRFSSDSFSPSSFECINSSIPFKNDSGINYSLPLFFPSFPSHFSIWFPHWHRRKTSTVQALRKFRFNILAWKYVFCVDVLRVHEPLLLLLSFYPLSNMPIQCHFAVSSIPFYSRCFVFDWIQSPVSRSHHRNGYRHHRSANLISIRQTLSSAYYQWMKTLDGDDDYSEEQKHIKIVFRKHRNTRRKFVHVELLTSQSKPYLLWFSLVNKCVDLCATNSGVVLVVELHRHFSIIDDIRIDSMVKIASKVHLNISHLGTVASHSRRGSSKR